MIRLYNTLSRRKEAVRPLDSAGSKKLKLFVCGVTTYDFSHIGHARTYIVFDAFVKYLRHRGFEVFYLQNITDIDDKIIQRAKETGEQVLKLARRFEREYRADMKALGVNAPTRYARATSHIAEIVSQVRRLLDKGYAYEIEGDGIYFDISKFKRYGKLSRRTNRQAQDAVSRIDESVRKRNKGDFALWKFSKVGEPKWKSPWGLGRPGWHIEDTAIAEKYFGPQYDIHGGARDLIFPHHEAEIAQMEAISGSKPLARYWMHTGFLTVQGEKMSKSLGNFVPIREFLKNHSARLLRFFVLKTHYRSPVDYSAELLEQAQSELSRFDEFIDRLRDTSQTPIRQLADKSQTISKFQMKHFKNSFEKALQNDFNIPLALSVLFDAARQGNIAMDQNRVSRAHAKEILAFFKEIDTYLGFLLRGKELVAIPAEVKALAQQREAHRRQGNFQEADALRAALWQKGWLVEDTSSGWKLKKLVYQKRYGRGKTSSPKYRG